MGKVNKETVEDLIEEISIENTIQKNINLDKLENLLSDEVEIENVYYEN
mgnify:CR=1 FL=1